jgi:predicted TIM-barrel fold metal-dependent hydrolase
MAEPVVIDLYTVFGFWAHRRVDVSLETLLGLMEKQKVARAATLSTEGILFDHRQGNETTARVCQEHPTLIPLATINPRAASDHPAEVKRCCDRGCKLFVLFPEHQGWEVESAEARACLAAVAEAGAAVMIEAAEPGAPTAVLRAVDSLALPIVLAGVNYRNLAEAIAVLRQNERFQVETHQLAAVGALETLAGEVGAARLLFGSRSPLHYYSSAYLTVRYSGLSDDDKAAVLGGNAARLLGVS